MGTFPPREIDIEVGNPQFVCYHGFSTSMLVYPRLDAIKFGNVEGFGEMLKKMQNSDRGMLHL